MQFQIDAGEIFLALSWHVVVLSLQYVEKYRFLSKFSLRDSMIEAFFGGFLWSFKK